MLDNVKTKKHLSTGMTLTERKKDVLFSYGLLFPALAVMALVILYPILNAIAMSFCDYTFFTVNKNPQWNDFGNYKKIFDDDFSIHLWHTVLFTLGTVTLELIIGMGIALLLNTRIRGRNALRSLFLMPWTIPSIVTALLWSWLFQAQYGIINYVLDFFGLIQNRNMEWMQNPDTSMLTVIIAVVWRQTPYMLVMILAGLQSVRQDLIEAAALDGANGAQIFWHVKIPAIKSVLGTTIITCIMSSFQQFTIIYNMTNGGPMGTTTTMSIAAYKQAFTSYDLGAGAAIGVIWLIILSVGVSIYNVKSKRFDNE